MGRNFKKYGKDSDFIKTLIDRRVREITKPQVFVTGGSTGRSLSSSGSSSGASSSGRLGDVFTKIVVEVFGGPFGVKNYPELVQRSGIIPHGGLFAEDDETNDRVNLKYEMYSDPNYWLN